MSSCHITCHSWHGTSPIHRFLRLHGKWRFSLPSIQVYYLIVMSIRLCANLIWQWLDSTMIIIQLNNWLDSDCSNCRFAVAPHSKFTVLDHGRPGGWRCELQTLIIELRTLNLNIELHDFDLDSIQTCAHANFRPWHHNVRSWGTTSLPENAILAIHAFRHANSNILQ